MTQGFVFYDLETSGRDPRWHCILQFAAIRTDAELNPIGEPLMLRGRLPRHILPEPEAMLVTGITPELALDGLPQSELAQTIRPYLLDGSPCLAGFNSIRFDDEFLRYSFFRALLPPYQHERGGRWDLLDVVRATRALRPEGMNWPNDAEGLPIARLTAITQANGIAHESAHDALSDVVASLEVARRILREQPRLFAHTLRLRQRSNVEALLEPLGNEPRLHVSGRLPRARFHFALVTPLVRHPRNPRSTLVFDLAQDPELLLTLSESEIERRLFTRDADLDVERLRIKEVRSNRHPFVAPLQALRREDSERLGVDRELVLKRHQFLLRHPEVARKVARVFSSKPPAAAIDVDAAVYEGMATDKDFAECRRLLLATPEVLTDAAVAGVRDRRLVELLGREVYRRDHNRLDPSWRERVESEMRRRLTGEIEGAVSLPLFFARIDALSASLTDDKQLALLSAWRQHGCGLARDWNIDVAGEVSTAP